MATDDRGEIAGAPPQRLSFGISDAEARHERDGGGLKPSAGRIHEMGVGGA